MSIFQYSTLVYPSLPQYTPVYPGPPRSTPVHPGPPSPPSPPSLPQSTNSPSQSTAVCIDIDLRIELRIESYV